MCVAALVEPAASGKVSGAQHLEWEGADEPHQSPWLLPWPQRSRGVQQGPANLSLAPLDPASFFSSTPPSLVLFLDSTQPRRSLRSSRSRTPPPAPSPSSLPQCEDGAGFVSQPRPAQPLSCAEQLSAQGGSAALLSEEQHLQPSSLSRAEAATTSGSICGSTWAALMIPTLLPLHSTAHVFIFCPARQTSPSTSHQRSAPYPVFVWVPFRPSLLHVERTCVHSEPPVGLNL